MQRGIFAFKGVGKCAGKKKKNNRGRQGGPRALKLNRLSKEAAVKQHLTTLGKNFGKREDKGLKVRTMSVNV